MDCFSGAPINYSSLVADEFDDMSADDAGGGDEDPEEHLPAEAPDEDVKLRRIKPRFELWLTERLRMREDKECKRLLQDLYNQLEVCTWDLDFSSSARQLRVDFKLSGVEGQYHQRSQSDPSSSAWDVQGEGDASLEMVPNVELELELNKEPVVTCKHYACATSRNRTWTNYAVLEQQFGLETSEKVGGAETLLQFLGTICADAGASCYAAALPFALPVALLAVTDAMGEGRTTRGSVPTTTTGSRLPPQRLPVAGQVPARAGAPGVGFKPAKRGQSPSPLSPL